MDQKVKACVELFREEVSKEGFKGFSIENQKTLVKCMERLYEIAEARDSTINKLEKLYDEWVDHSFEYQYKYHCYYNIYKLSFWKRLKFLFNPFSIQWEDVKDFVSHDHYKRYKIIESTNEN